MSENRLYIIMRNDMASLNPGKACAQAAHAANQFVSSYGKRSAVRNWQNEAKGFGTTIVLAANEGKIHSILDQIVFGKKERIYCDAVYDPSYPIRDGKVTHYIDILTCAYIFGSVEQVAEFVQDLPLMD